MKAAIKTSTKGIIIYVGTPSLTWFKSVTADSLFSARTVQTSSGIWPIAVAASPVVVGNPIETPAI